MRTATISQQTPSYHIFILEFDCNSSYVNVSLLVTKNRNKTFTIYFDFFFILGYRTSYVQFLEFNRNNDLSELGGWWAPHTN